MDNTYFNERIVNELGLSVEDYSVILRSKSGNLHKKTFFEADDKGNIIMKPFTLDRQFITYDHPNATPEKPNIYNNRENIYQITRLKKTVNTDDGDEIRYLFPKNQGTFPFLTPALIEKFEKKEKINTLFLTEGILKQYGGYKNGLDIIGLTSITHYREKKTQKLHTDIIRIIQDCQVKNVVMIYDGDCTDISAKALSKKEDITKRPYSFLSSAKTIRELLKNFGVQFFFCHVKSSELENHPKGLDDLFAAFKGHEQEIIDDLKSFDQSATFFFKLNITESLKRLYDYFKIDDLPEFFQSHKHKIQETEFNFKGKYYQWSDEDEKLHLNIYDDNIPVVFDEDSKFWGIKPDTDCTLYFDYDKAYKFLEANNFFRFELVNNDYIFIHIKGKVVHEVQAFKVKDFIIRFLKSYGDNSLLNLIFRGGTRYLGPQSVGNLAFKTLSFPRGGKNWQCLYFKNSVWYITPDAIREILYENFPNHVWAEQVIDFEPTLLDPLFSIERKDNNELRLETARDHNSHFLQFLINTSKIYWREEENAQITDEQRLEQSNHLINKISALGYLLHNYRDDSKVYAVIGMDNRISDVGESNGGTGKSIFGFAVSKITSYEYLSGKPRKFTENPHIWQNITEKTCFIFIDDARISFDFEFLYPVITGQMTINPKGIAAFTLPKDKTPKLYISTNHALHINGDSDERRQFKIAFSDYYNKSRTPESETGQVFFSRDWPADQRNLFYNIVASSIQVYLKYGKIDAPGLNLRLRELRQQMSEEFFQWASEYFSGQSNLNVELFKKDLYNSFTSSLNSIKANMWSPSKFKKSIKYYCEYGGYTFNPKQNGEDHKSNGIEYFTIGTKE